ncbi:TcdA/TcdB catalytic glycosyltransferase domain-containing protein, partial [Escherichia coli]|uniref:TcdA/TcdB catalytic glycosyltransferase domain-containing protein n=1 Tax=Escherichia coli TaxID=562 RepID=UPI000F0AA061
MRVETVKQEYHKNDNIEQHIKKTRSKRRIKTASMDSVIEIGKRIQAEISSTLQPNNYKIASTKGNWKSALMIRAGLLFSNYQSMSTEKTREYKAVISHGGFSSFHLKHHILNNEKDAAMNDKFKYMENENRIHLKKMRKRRSVDDVIDDKQLNKKTIYDITSDNIDKKIGWNIEKKNKISPELIDKLKSNIDKYQELSDKNSREGIYLLKTQSNALSQIYKNLQVNEDNKLLLINIKSIIKQIQNEYVSHKVSIEKNIHVVWVAGAPPDSITKYATAYKLAYPDFIFNLWIDIKAMGAYIFNKILREIAFDNAKHDLIASLNKEELNIIKNNAPIGKKLQDKLARSFEYNLLKSQIKIQDSFMNYAYIRGVLNFSDGERIGFLKDILNYDEKKIESFQAEINKNRERTDLIKEKLISILGEDKVVIHDVSTLSDMKIVHRKQHYQQELILRWNYASATDQLRMYILKEHGGIYTDCDVTPGYTKAVYNILEENSNNFDFLEKEECRRAFNDEILSIASNEESSGYKNKLSNDEKTRLDKIIHEIKKIGTDNLFSPIDTTVIRDSMLMSKRYQWWGEDKGWNIRGNNNFLATHKGSKVTEFVISGQDNAYRQLFDIREKLRTESINVQHHYYAGDNIEEINSGSIKKNTPLDHKEYGIGSLFSKYRMDGIIPRVYSTLHITGPDAIMKSMRDYYNSLGALGQCRLDPSNKHFKGLSQDSFIGNLKRINGIEGEHYDWKNQESFGINDITPDDVSSWTAKVIDIKSFLYDIVYRDQPNTSFPPPVIEIDVKRLTIGWPSEVKGKLRSLWPNFEDEYNRLLNGNFINLNSLSNIDKKIHQYLILSENKLVKWSGISLAEKLNDYLNKFTIPIGNKVHYLLSEISEQHDEYKKSMFSVLASDPDAKLVIWRNDKYNKYLVIKELSILQGRKSKIEELMKECSPQQHDNLKIYHRLKRKEQLGMITPEEQLSLIDTITLISEDQGLKQRIIDIENTLHSFYIEKKLVSNLDKIQNIKSLKGVGSYRDIEYLWNRYVGKEQEILNDIMNNAQSRNLQDKIEIKDVSNELSHSTLINKLVYDGYGFDDFKQVMKYNILYREPGLLLQKAVVAVPSGELVDIINKHTSNNDVETSAILNKLYQHFFGDKTVDFDSSIEEQRIKINFELVLSELDLDNLGKYFLSPLIQNVSPFGVKFSSDNGVLTSDIIASGLRSFVSDERSVVLDKMNDYLSLLYDIKKDIYSYNRINVELIKTMFHKASLSFMLKDDLNLNPLLDKNLHGGDISLTELSQILTGNKNFVECSNVITFGDYPSITNNIIKDIKSSLPSIYSMSDLSGIEQRTLKGIGYIGNTEYILTTPSFRKLHNASIQAKYRTLNWSDFYGRNARIWQEMVMKLGGGNVRYHPQMLLTPEEGRCIGLSELYLLVKNVNTFQTLQKNIDLASSLYQDFLLNPSYLTERNRKFLDSVLSQIQYAQNHGNNVLLQSADIDSIRLSDFSINDAVKYLLERNTKNILVVTEYHSMAVLNIDGRYRVVDPNFGYADFSILENALGFIKQSIQITPEVHELYTGDLSNRRLDILFSKKQDWDHIVSTDLFLLTKFEHESTQEILKKNNAAISIGGREFNVLNLYKYGVLFNGNRVDESVTKVPTGELEGRSFHIDKNILGDYINNNYLTSDVIDEITVLERLLYGHNNNIKELLKNAEGKNVENLLSRHNDRFLNVIRNTYTELNEKIKKYLSEGFKLNDIIHSDSNAVTLLLSNHETKKHIDVDISEIKMSLREGVNTLSDAIDNMNLDGIMSILGIIQYSRLAYTGAYIGPLDQAGFVSDTKNILEKIVGVTLISIGERKFGTTISSINLESIAAQKISELAVSIGGRTGKMLSRLSSVVKFPVLDTTLNFWSLGESIKAYTSISEDSLDKKLAEIDLVFSSVSTALTLSSFIYPPLGFATFPLLFLQQDVRNFETALYQDKVRRDAWKEVEKYLDESAKKIIDVDNKNGIINLSSCEIIGDVVIDLSVSPPKISGRKSYNYGKDIGSVPFLSDEEVRKKSKYAISCTDSSDLNINNMFGSVKEQVCSDLSSFTNIVTGFANRVWPKDMPVIQEGNYKTVILGYSSQIKANTEVIRTAWNNFQEVAREGMPLVEKLYRNSKIISGDNLINVVIPKLSTKHFSTEDINLFNELSNYSFTIEGGRGGVVVYSNGVGHFNIKCRHGVKNTLSFRELNERTDAIINIRLDLNKNDKQTVVSYKWLTQPFPHHIMMSLIQENINTVVGSDIGKNVFIGNNDSNHFIIGSASTKLHLGEGDNVITIDKIKHSRVHLDIYPGSAESTQYIQLGCGIDKLLHVNKHKDRLHLYFDEFFDKIITIHNIIKQPGVYIQPVFYLSSEDGLE